MSDQRPWVCEVCSRPIAADGVIELYNRRAREMPDYDPDAPQQTVAIGDHGEVLRQETAKLQVEAAIRKIDDPGVEMHVWHTRCAPPGRVTDCEIACPRAMEQWATWIEHLTGNSWIKRRDIRRLIRFWFKGHNIPMPTL